MADVRGNVSRREESSLINITHSFIALLYIFRSLKRCSMLRYPKAHVLSTLPVSYYNYKQVITPRSPYCKCRRIAALDHENLHSHFLFSVRSLLFLPLSKYRLPSVIVLSILVSRYFNVVISFFSFLFTFSLVFVNRYLQRARARARVCMCSISAYQSVYSFLRPSVRVPVNS